MYQSLRTTPWACLLCLLIAGLAGAAENSDERAINQVLDDFHQAAADADETRYLGHFSADGVFMGTDDWERWPLEDFREYVAKRFAGGTGWTYVPQQRHIAFAAGNSVAWFDEVMVTERWGRFRGTGVLLKQGAAWKIAHYSLTALVPNERFEDVSEIASKGFEERENTP